MRILLTWMWVYPALIMTAWTLLNWKLAQRAPTGKRTFSLFSFPGQAEQASSASGRWRNKRTKLMLLCALITGLIPVVCAFLLVVQLVLVVMGVLMLGYKFYEKRTV